MNFDFVKSGKITVEVKMFNPERLLNLLWSEGIEVSNVKKIDIITVKMVINYMDYDEVKDYVIRFKGMIEIINANGLVVFLMKLKRKKTYAIGALLFAAIIIVLSNFVWGVKICNGNIVSPYEVRKCLYSNGIKPGTLKKNIDITKAEEIIEENNSNISWVRARVKGSVLVIDFKEKITPPKPKNKDDEDEDIVEGKDVVASMDGEIIKIYTSSGTAVVHKGDYVKKGDVLIQGIEGKEEYQYNVNSRGTVIAKTLMERTSDIKLEGTELKRTGEIKKDYYINLFGKKIYLKKCDKTFKDYDKIENTSKFIKEDDYYIKKEVSIKENSDNLINREIEKIDNDVKINLKRSDVLLDKNINLVPLDDGMTRIIVTYSIERDIGVSE